MPRATWGDVGPKPFDDELDEYDVYEGETPPKGVYTVLVRSLRLKQNKNDDYMLNGLLIIKEPAKSPKAKYNGFSFWFNLNITEQGARWVNNFLSVLVPGAKVRALRKAFWDQKVMIDKEEPPNILSIGTWKFADNEVLVRANTKFKPKRDGYDESLDVLRFLPLGEKTDEEEDAEDEDTTGDDAEWEEEETTEESEEEESEEDYSDEDVEERQEELEELTTKELKAILKEHGYKLADYKGKEDEALVDMILNHEFPPVDEDEEEEPEPEPEPEPEKPVRRRRTATAKPEPAATKPAGRRRRKEGEPPF